MRSAGGAPGRGTSQPGFWQYFGLICQSSTNLVSLFLKRDKFDYSFLVFVFFLQHVHRSRYHSCSYFGSCIPLKSVCGAGASAFARPEPPADRARRLRHARQHVAAARAGTFFAFCQVYQLQMLSHSVHVVSFSALVTFSFLSSDIRPGIRWQ